MTQTELTPIASRTGKWKPYSDYKDLGVEWLGEIPTHWEVKRLKDVAVMNPDVLTEDTDSNYVLRYIDISNVDSNGFILIAQELQFGDAPSRARRTVKHGDIIISTVRTYLRAIGLIEEPPENLVVSTGFAVLRPNSEVYYKFLWRLAQSSEFVDAVVSHSEGVGYPAINPNRLADLPVWLPPLPEQRAIAAFLDRETARINALIAKKERLIELLQEKRAAIISHAVTKGLDPTMPIKDSGVEWLGEIPEHWEVKRMKFCLNSVEQGWSPTCENRPAELDEWGVLKVGCVNGVKFNPDENKALPAESQPIPELEIKQGDVLVSRANTRELLGSASVVTKVRPHLLLCDKLYRLYILPKTVNPIYLVLAMGSSIIRFQLERDATGASNSMQNISQGTILNLAIPLPDMLEQHAIVAHLNIETAQIDALISRIRDGIEKLKEYSTALISAAVTGKIDVREEISMQGSEM